MASMLDGAAPYTSAQMVADPDRLRAILQYLNPAVAQQVQGDYANASRQFAWGPEEQAAFSAAQGANKSQTEQIFNFQGTPDESAKYRQFTPLNQWLASNEGAWQEGYKDTFRNAIYDPKYGLLLGPGSGLGNYNKETGMSPAMMFALAMAAFGGLSAAGVGAGTGGAAGAGGMGANVVTAADLAGWAPGSALPAGADAAAFAGGAGTVTAADIAGWQPGSPLPAGSDASAWGGASTGAAVGGGAGGANTTGQIVGSAAPQESMLSQLGGAYKAVQPYASLLSSGAQLISGKSAQNAAQGASDSQRATAESALAAQQAALDRQNATALAALQQQKAAQAAQLEAQRKAAAEQLALQQSMAAYQRQVQMQQLASQMNSAKLQEYQMNRSNQRMPDYSAVLQGIRGQAQGGQGGTMLTGASGVDPSLLLLGRNTLLGAG